MRSVHSFVVFITARVPQVTGPDKDKGSNASGFKDDSVIEEDMDSDSDDGEEKTPQRVLAHLHKSLNRSKNIRSLADAFE